MIEFSIHTRPACAHHSLEQPGLGLLRMRNHGLRLRLEALQQESGVYDEGDADGEQCVHEEVQLGLSEAVLPQPFQNISFGMDVAPIYAREAPPKVDNRREIGHAPFPRVPRIRHLDESYVKIVGLAIDVLQLLRDDFALVRIYLVWNTLNSFRIFQTDILTKENRDELVLFQQLLQHLLVHLFDLVLDLEDVLRGQPLEDSLGLGQVALVDHRRLLAEVHERRQVVQSLFCSSFGAADLDKVDAEHVGFPVDVFQVFQDFVALGTVFVVCNQTVKLDRWSVWSLQKKTARNGDSFNNLDNILSLTDSISSASSRLSSSINHSKTDSSFWRSPSNRSGLPLRK
jgi:hypothetical protein